MSSPGVENIRSAMRFLGSLVPSAIMMLLIFGVIGLVSVRFASLTGTLVGFVAASSLVLGIVLAYWNLVDSRNLAIIRRTVASSASWRDGAIVAFEGTVRTESTPLSGAVRRDAVCCVYLPALVLRPELAGPERASCAGAGFSSRADAHRWRHAERADRRVPVVRGRPARKRKRDQVGRPGSRADGPDR